MMYQFSGVNTITFYAVDVFEASGTTWDKNTCAIVMGVIRLIFTIVGCICMRRCGRRPLTFISSKSKVIFCLILQIMLIRIYSTFRMGLKKNYNISIIVDFAKVLAVVCQWFLLESIFTTNINWINMFHQCQPNTHGFQSLVYLHLPFAVALAI